MATIYGSAGGSGYNPYAAPAKSKVAGKTAPVDRAEAQRLATQNAMAKAAAARPVSTAAQMANTTRLLTNPTGALAATPPAATAPAAPTYDDGAGGGGSGGGSGSVAGAGGAVAYPTESVDDYVHKNFLYTNQLNENQRDLSDYDAQTLRDRQLTESEQAVRRASLQRAMANAGQDNAEDYASRGLGRSGLVFKAQDDINARGVEQGQGIDKLLTDFVTQRQSGRQQAEKTGRSSLAAVMQKLTDDYNARQNARLTGSAV